jgi:acyl carrier protein
MAPERIRAAVVSALSELGKVPVESISDSDNLMNDLGIDSMAAVNLLFSIEDKLGTALPPGCEGSLVGARTVSELTEQIADVLSAT